MLPRLLLVAVLDKRSNCCPEFRIGFTPSREQGDAGLAILHMRHEGPGGRPAQDGHELPPLHFKPIEDEEMRERYQVRTRVACTPKQMLQCKGNVRVGSTSADPVAPDTRQIDPQ
jgi:hypothetical protein